MPNLVTPKWVEDAKVNWGEDSPMYQIRVLGDFPSESEDTLISLKIIESAVEGEDPTPRFRTTQRWSWVWTWRASAATGRSYACGRATG